MRDTVSLLDMRVITGGNTLTDYQVNFIRDNYTKMSYEDLKNESGVYIHKIVQMLKKWNVKKPPVIGRIKPPKPFNPFFDVNEKLDWIGC